MKQFQRTTSAVAQQEPPGDLVFGGPGRSRSRNYRRILHSNRIETDESYQSPSVHPHLQSVRRWTSELRGSKTFFTFFTTKGFGREKRLVAISAGVFCWTSGRTDMSPSAGTWRV